MRVSTKPFFAVMNYNAVCFFVSPGLQNGEKTYFSKAVHPTVVADPNSLLGSIEVVVIIWGTGWIVNDHRRGTALDYVYGDVVSPGKCQELRLSTPDPGITDGGAVYFELLRGYETGICGTNPVFTVH